MWFEGWKGEVRGLCDWEELYAKIKLGLYIARWKFVYTKKEGVMSMFINNERV